MKLIIKFFCLIDKKKIKSNLSKKHVRETERSGSMKNLGQKVIMILCCCLFLTGCSIDSEYLILKKSEILDTKRFDKEYEKKMKKALENGTAQKRHFRFEWVSKSV